MAENSCLDAKDHEEQLQRDERFQAYVQQEAYKKIQQCGGITYGSSNKTKQTTTSSFSSTSSSSGSSFKAPHHHHHHHQFRRKPRASAEEQNEDSGIGSPSERNGEKSYAFNVHSSSKFLLDPATNISTTTASKFSPRSSTSSNNSSCSNNCNNNNGYSVSFHLDQQQLPANTTSSQQQQQRVADKQNYKNRAGRPVAERLYVGNNASSNGRHPTRHNFLGRFRSQTNIASNSSSSSFPFPLKFAANGSSKSVMTSPVDHPPPSPVSLKSSTGNLASHHHGSKSHKPKKWFSFTNLLSRQNLSGILNIPKSRLSVSSTLNSVFVGPTSPSPSAESCPGSGRGSGTFFNGFNNLNGEGGSGGGGVELSSSPGRTFSLGGGGGLGYVPPASPTPSCATVSGEFPSRSLSAGANSNSGQVVFRRKNNNVNGKNGSTEGSGSTPSSSLQNCGSRNGTGPIVTANFNLNGNSSSGSGPASGNFSKHYSSGSGCGNSESASERSSGIGYSSYNSTAGSSASIGHYGPSSTTGNNNRLSCGEFFTGTPNSPIYSTGTPSDFPFQFSFSSEHPSGQFDNCTGSCPGEGRHSNYYNHRKTLGRSLPALLEAMEGSSCPGSPENGYAQVSVESVSNLLYQEYVILTGAKSRSDHYLMIFPDRGNFQLLGDDDYRRLMIYLTSVPPMQDAESGFVLIIDRRNDKWNSVKTTLIRISSYFPGLIHRVFVLRPVGFIQKALSEVSTKLFRTENLKFRLTVCNNVSDLGAYVEPTQLLAELGGYLCYDKVKWVQQRTEVEAFYTALQSLSKDLKSFTESFQDLEYPNDVVSTEELIQEKENIFDRLKSDLVQSGEHGENLLKRIKHSESSQSLNSSGSGSAGEKIKSAKKKANAEGNLVRTSSSTQLINVISVERFIIQIEETARLFEDFWLKEKHTLEQCLRLRRFEQDFRELQAIFDANTRILNELAEMGENLEGTDSLIAETLSFELSTTDDISRAMQVEQFGREIVETNPSAVDTVEPKCAELARVTANFKAVIQEKIAKQKEWREVQLTIEKANKLCTEGMDLMTTGPGAESAEDCPDVGTRTLSQIDSFLDRAQPMVDELISLKSSLKSPSSSQSKTLVKQVLKRVEDVQIMCAKRRSLVVQQITKTKSRRSSGSSLVSTPGSVSSSGTGANQPGFPNEMKSAKSTSQLDFSAEEYSSCSLRSGSSSLSLDGTINPRNNGKIEESWEIRKVKRGHVLKELLDTERSYVEEIGDVLSGYYGQIENSSLKSLLPSQLQPVVTKSNEEKPSRNVSVLFCNLEEIHAFHAKLFYPDLSACIQSVQLVGLCFIQRHAEFLSMYSQYCQLLPASEVLRKEIREDHPWFLACRNRLGHKLPLGAYLLKPVQRITKYHLLLKDLVKNSEGCEGFNELVEALECMLVVLRCVNDGMHQLAITGYKGKLIDEGYLLQQGSFLLWNETKKDRLRIKGHERHLFLYQRSILICKKKASTYEFKDKLNMSEIGLTEALKGSGAAKKFEIWVNGRHKVFVLQAETQDMKDLWVREIKKLLLEQLESLRAIKAQNANNITPNTTNIITTNIPHTAAGKRQRMMGSKGVTMNGWRNAHLPHRPLRQVCSWDSCEPKRPKSRTTTECEIDEEQWSSEISNSDDEDSNVLGPSSVLGTDLNQTVYGIGQNVEDSPKYLVLADYNALGHAEITVREGDIVILVKVGCAGWWFVKSCNAAGDTIAEGWAPSAYLERLEGQHGKLSTVGSNRNSFSPATPPSLSDSTVTTPTKIHNISPNFANYEDNSPELHNFGRSRELEKITNDIVTALR